MPSRKSLQAGERVRVEWPHGPLSAYGAHKDHNRHGTVSEVRESGIVALLLDGDSVALQWHESNLVRLPRKGDTVKEVQTALVAAVRLTNTVNGNPRYRLITADGEYLISSDSACAYDVQNILHRKGEGEAVPVTLSLTRAGRVWNISTGEGQ